MHLFAIAAASAFFLGAGIALLAPLAALRAPAAAIRRAARRHLAYGGGIVAVCAARWTGITFAWHGANVAAIVLALLAGGALALFVFCVGRRPFAIAAGLLCSAAWCAAVLATMLVAALEGNSAVTVDLGAGLFCTQSVYGSVVSDSGDDTQFDRRFLFIDRRLYAHRASVLDPVADPAADATVAPAWRPALARCQALVDALRKAAISPGAPAPR